MFCWFLLKKQSIQSISQLLYKHMQLKKFLMQKHQQYQATEKNTVVKSSSNSHIKIQLRTSQKNTRCKHLKSATGVQF